MSLSKASFIDKIEVTEGGHVGVRIVTRILENGQPLAGSDRFFRTVLSPGQDMSVFKVPGVPIVSAADLNRVAAIAGATWTPEVIAAHRATLAEAEKRHEEEQREAAIQTAANAAREAAKKATAR